MHASETADQIIGPVTLHKTALSLAHPGKMAFFASRSALLTKDGSSTAMLNPSLLITL